MVIMRILVILLFSSALLRAGQIEVFFSPKGGCTEAVVDALSNAKTSVFVQAYSFTSVPIAKALIDAQKRGVKISVILDKSNQADKYTAATTLANYGIEPLIDSKHAIAHNKIMILDGKTILTGSFNFTKAAESNAENLLVIHDSTLAAKYLANWQEHQKHSHPYEPSQGTSPRKR